MPPPQASVEYKIDITFSERANIDALTLAIGRVCDVLSDRRVPDAARAHAAEALKSLMHLATTSMFFANLLKVVDDEISSVAAESTTLPSTPPRSE